MIARDFLGNTWEFDCMGCAIARESMPVPGGFIHRTGQFCVHQDPLVPFPGFLVIASTRHIRTIAGMTETEYAEFSVLIRDTHAAIKSATQVECLTLIQEERSNHFHLWFFPWLPDIIKNHGEPSLTGIRGIMAEVSRQTISADDWGNLEKTIERIKLYPFRRST